MPNGHWHIHSTRTGPIDPTRGLSGWQMVPRHSPVRRWAQETPPGSYPLAKRSLALPQQPQGAQRTVRGPCDSPNGPWYLPSARTGPSDPTRGPTDRKWSLAPPQHTHGPQRL
ncbi:UNVERIFIED_CONTAM: hypothetical protein FKN15_042471 [Acipenser sinensis]